MQEHDQRKRDDEYRVNGVFASAVRGYNETVPPGLENAIRQVSGKQNLSFMLGVLRFSDKPHLPRELSINIGFTDQTTRDALAEKIRDIFKREGIEHVTLGLGRKTPEGCVSTSKDLHLSVKEQVRGSLLDNDFGRAFAHANSVMSPGEAAYRQRVANQHAEIVERVNGLKIGSEKQPAAEKPVTERPAATESQHWGYTVAYAAG